MSSFNLKQFQNQLSLKALKIFLKTIQLLPRWCAQGLFGGLSRIAYRCIWNLRKICQENLRFVYGNTKSEKEYKDMTWACFDNIGRSMMDLLYFVERPKELSKIVNIHNEESLIKVLQGNQGAIIATAHLGNFPLMFVSLVQKGYKVNVVIRSMRDEGFGKFMYELCALWKIKMIETFPQRHFIKEAFGALKRNELLVILLDEVVPREEGVLVDFFNSKVARGPGPLLFHERLGSPILPMFIAQDKEERFDIFIEEPLKVEKGFSVDENMVKNISTLTTIIETFVRKYPAQWGGWLNKRWISSRTVKIA